MNENISQKLVDQLVKIDLTSADVLEQEISELLDEQPYLMGFLFNLAEEFTEEEYDLLMRCCLALNKSLSAAGLFFEMISPEMLEAIIKQKVTDFEGYGDEDNFLDDAKMFEKASSPVVLKQLQVYLDDNLYQIENTAENRSGMLLIVSVLIELFETSATTESPIEKDDN